MISAREPPTVTAHGSQYGDTKGVGRDGAAADIEDGLSDESGEPVGSQSAGITLHTNPQLRHLFKSKRGKRMRSQSQSRDENISKSDKPDCRLCFEFDGVAILFPCLHAGICLNCAKRLYSDKKPCPFCRRSVVNYKKFYSVK